MSDHIYENIRIYENFRNNPTRRMTVAEYENLEAFEKGGKPQFGASNATGPQPQYVNMAALEQGGKPMIGSETGAITDGSLITEKQYENIEQLLKNQPPAHPNNATRSP